MFVRLQHRRIVTFARLVLHEDLGHLRNVRTSGECPDLTSGARPHGRLRSDELHVSIDSSGCVPLRVRDDPVRDAQPSARGERWSLGSDTRERVAIVAFNEGVGSTELRRRHA